MTILWGINDMKKDDDYSDYSFEDDGRWRHWGCLILIAWVVAVVVLVAKLIKIA